MTTSHSPEQNSTVTAIPEQNENTCRSARERIQQCALELFGRKGFAATSVREIVEGAGVTKPTLYYYFKDKEHLYESLITGTVNAFHVELSEVLRMPGTLEERLVRIVEMHLQRVQTNPELVRFMFRALLGLVPQSPRIDSKGIGDRSTELMMGVFREAAAEGVIAPEAASEFAVLQFIGAINMYLIRGQLGYKDDLSPPLADKIVRLFLKGLLSYHSDPICPTSTS